MNSICSQSLSPHTCTNVHMQNIPPPKTPKTTTPAPPPYKWNNQAWIVLAAVTSTLTQECNYNNTKQRNMDIGFALTFTHPLKETNKQRTKTTHTQSISANSFPFRPRFTSCFKSTALWQYVIRKQTITHIYTHPHTCWSANHLTNGLQIWGIPLCLCVCMSVCVCVAV